MNNKMKAAVLVRKGDADKAFEIKQVAMPIVPDNFILIKVEAFGLNYADVTARQGQYKDAPPMPSILGYDVCGTVVAVGADVTLHKVGQRVTALTRFGGYAEYATTDERAAVKITDDMDVCAALALATQGATAWYCAKEALPIYKNERVVITAAAGGVGSLLVQLVKMQGAKVYGIVSSEAKEQVIKSLGADGALNRSKGDIFEQYQSLEGTKAIDVMLDSAGGSYVKKGVKNLSPGGRMLCYGGSQGGKARNLFQLVPFALSFGFYHPVLFLMQSQSLIGVNMLRIADHKPDVLQHCLLEIMNVYNEGALKPLAGKAFSINNFSEAQNAIEYGQVPGKVAVKW
jgi:NADPH:quinone reductase-like Zn-dependent oxidoreductase